MIILVGGIVGIIVVSMYLPLFRVTTRSSKPVIRLDAGYWSRPPFVTEGKYKSRDLAELRQPAQSTCSRRCRAPGAETDPDRRTRKTGGINALTRADRAAQRILRGVGHRDRPPRNPVPRGVRFMRRDGSSPSRSTTQRHAAARE